MREDELDTMLFTLTEKEKRYLASDNPVLERYAGTPTKMVNGRRAMCFELDHLDVEGLRLRRDSRFIGLPAYTYSSINLNYIYSGQCTYEIDGQEQVLERGDVCIFDRGVARSKMPLGMDDIVININLSDQLFRRCIPDVRTQSPASAFLLSRISEDSDHSGYIIFRTRGNERIESLFQQLLLVFYEGSAYYLQLAQAYLTVIIPQLLLLYQEGRDTSSIRLADKEGNRMLEIIAYIESHCESCTLGDVAKEFGYHEKYLCAYIRKHGGTSFSEIRRDCRLRKASWYLRNTDWHIEDVLGMVGYGNRSQFYRDFRHAFSMLPNEYRHQKGKMDELP